MKQTDRLLIKSLIEYYGGLELIKETCVIIDLMEKGKNF